MVKEAVLSKPRGAAFDENCDFSIESYFKPYIEMKGPTKMMVLVVEGRVRNSSFLARCRSLAARFSARGFLPAAQKYVR